MNLMKSRNVICSILILAIVVSFATPLSAFQGYVLILALLFLFILGWRAMSIKRIVLIMGIIGLYVIFIINTPSLFVDRGHLNTSLLTVVMISVLLMIVPDTAEKKDISDKKFTVLDAAYLVFYSVCLYELVKYTVSNISSWDIRHSNPTFFLGYHHVDFSVIVMAVFMIGMKREFYALSIFLAASAWIILPARTMQLFFILFVVCWVFKEKMYAISVKCKIINKSFKWMLIFFAGSIIFSFVWLSVLTLYFEVVEGHEGLYDTSNFERFQTILYAVRVIVKKRLYFNGLDSTAIYRERLIGSIWKGFDFAGPHNSYVSLLLFYSVSFGGIYLFGLSKIIDQVFSSKMLPYILPYLVCGCILHDMLIGVRAVMFVTVLILPYREKKRELIKVCPIRFRLC